MNSRQTKPIIEFYLYDANIKSFWSSHVPYALLSVTSYGNIFCHNPHTDYSASSSEVSFLYNRVSSYMTTK